MKINSILVLGYSSALSGGVSKVTDLLVDNMNEMELHPILICYHPRLESLLRTFFSFICFLTKLLYKIRKYNTIVVIIGSSGDAIRTLPFIWLSFLLQKNTCIHFHKSTDIILDKIKSQYVIDLILKTWQKVSLHCFLSNNLEYQHKKIVNYEINSIVIPNAISEKWLNTVPLPYSKRRRDVVFFGRWSWEKGVLDLTAAMNKTKYDGLCEIYSNAPANVKYDKCVLSPWVDENKVYEIMKNAKLLVLPSYAEAYPTVLLEAVSCGTPFIASNIAGIPDIACESECGMLFEPGDVEDLTNKIDLILGDESMWNKLSKNNRTWIETHTIENITNKWRNSLVELEKR